MNEKTRDECETIASPPSAPIKYCGYGSCGKRVGHDGVHRCRCGRLVDVVVDEKTCGWHQQPPNEPALILAAHQLDAHLPYGIRCTCGVELSDLNPRDGATGRALALAAHQALALAGAQALIVREEDLAEAIHSAIFDYSQDDCGWPIVGDDHPAAQYLAAHIFGAAS